MKYFNFSNDKTQMENLLDAQIEFIKAFVTYSEKLIDSNTIEVNNKKYVKPSIIKLGLRGLQAQLIKDLGELKCKKH